MKLESFAQVFEQKNEGQGFAGVVVAVFVTILIGAVLLAPIQTTINTTQSSVSTFSNLSGTSGSVNSTVQNIPLLFAVMLLVAVLAAMIAIIS